jgi:protein-tyrosine-phosphatase
MKHLDLYLSELEEIVAKKGDNAFIRLLDYHRKHLGLLIQDIRKDADEVSDIFHKWENDIGPLGFQFRFKKITQAYFALGSSTDKIAALTEDIDYHREGIRDYLALMGHKALVLIGEHQLAATAPAPVLGKPGKAAAGRKSSGKIGRRPSPSPSPSPPKRDLKIIFVDPMNKARSVVGEALARLIGEWTKASKGDWRLKTIHSAGMHVKNKTDCLDALETLNKRLVDGGESPNAVAMDAVFDNKNFDYAFKKPIQDQMLKKKSIGVKRSIFKTYDFILVFTSREHETLLKLKTALVEKDGKEATARGKGRILHLGSYLTLDGIPREIEDPKSTVGKDAKVSRADWNWKVAQIRLAFKEFLKQELQWKMPPPRESGKKASDFTVVVNQGAEKTAGEKKPDGKKPEEKKASDRKEPERKPNEKKAVDQKPEKKQGPSNKEAEKKSDEKIPSEKKAVDKTVPGKKQAEKKVVENKQADRKDSKSQAK